MRRTVAALSVLVLGSRIGAAQANPRILLIPLDDRPSSVRFPVRIGAIAGAEVLTPPHELLGRFTRPADSDGVIAWMRTMLRASGAPGGVPRVDAVVVSVDLLAYGGLVASRTLESAPLETALARLEILRAIRTQYPALPIYASASLMRLAPTADGRNESYREALARWAEIAPDSMRPDMADELARLRAMIPAAVLRAYRDTRTRNQRVHLALLELSAAGILTHLVFTQDDARARGVHLAERAGLQVQVTRRGVDDRVSIQSGTDEFGMLLVARALLAGAPSRPAVAVTYVAPRDSARLMPFEDRPLAETVAAHLRLAGATVARGDASAALRLIVQTDRGAPRAAELVRESPRPVILADIDPTGAIQGADTLLTDALTRAGDFASLTGYGAWNTAGNAIGTAVAHGLVRWLAMQDASMRSEPARQAAQAAFLLDRWLDDDLYKSRIRPGLIAAVRARGWDPFRLTDAQTAIVEEEIRTAVTRRVRTFGDLAPVIGPRCALTSPIEVRLPWGRTFEAAFEFTVACK
jgi:hypothetical protein